MVGVKTLMRQQNSLRYDVVGSVVAEVSPEVVETDSAGEAGPDAGDAAAIYLRSEIDHLRFGTAPTNDLADLPNAPIRSQPSAANSRKLLTTFLQGLRSAGSTPSEGVDFHQELSTLTSAGWTGLEPAASGVTGADCAGQRWTCPGESQGCGGGNWTGADWSGLAVSACKWLGRAG
jgi:hypothetical protein